MPSVKRTCSVSCDSLSLTRYKFIAILLIPSFCEIYTTGSEVEIRGHTDTGR